jgi:hypothetical protein
MSLISHRFEIWVAAAAGISKNKDGVKMIHSKCCWLLGDLDIMQHWKPLYSVSSVIAGGKKLCR